MSQTNGSHPLPGVLQRADAVTPRGAAISLRAPEPFVRQTELPFASGMVKLPTPTPRCNKGQALRNISQRTWKPVWAHQSTVREKEAGRTSSNNRPHFRGVGQPFPGRLGSLPAPCDGSREMMGPPKAQTSPFAKRRGFAVKLNSGSAEVALWCRL